MMEFRVLVEELFSKELKTAEWAQSNLDIVRELLAKARENGTNEERVAFRWAERGAMEWQAECFEKLGRAVWFYYGRKRKEESDALATRPGAAGED